MSPWQKLMVSFVLRGRVSEEIVAWAYTELSQGRDTPDLRILAGLRPPLDWSEVDHYFNATLRDLGWEVEDGTLFLRDYILEIARDIVAGTRHPVPASHEIYRIYADLDYPVEFSNWLDITDGIDPDTGKYVYGTARDEIIVREAKRTIDESSKS